MNRYYALGRREWLEHRGAFFWTPLAILGLILLMAVLGLTLGLDRFAEQAALAIDGSGEGVDSQPPESAAPEQDFEPDTDLRRMLYFIAQPFLVIYFIAAWFVLLDALISERRDRTVLFWKSLPVTDTETVLSKLINVIWVAPLVTIGSIVLMQLSLLTLIHFFCDCGDHSWASLWSEAQLPLRSIEWLIGFATQGLWWLPLWSWLLLVSAVAPRLPMLWAVLPAALLMFVEWAWFGTLHIAGLLSERFDSVALPRYGANEASQIGLREILAFWLSPDLWLGVLIAAALIAATVHCRRRFNEL